MPLSLFRDALWRRSSLGLGRAGAGVGKSFSQKGMISRLDAEREVRLKARGWRRAENVRSSHWGNRDISGTLAGWPTEAANHGFVGYWPPERYHQQPERRIMG